MRRQTCRGLSGRRWDETTCDGLCNRQLRICLWRRRASTTQTSSTSHDVDSTTSCRSRRINPRIVSDVAETRANSSSRTSVTPVDSLVDYLVFLGVSFEQLFRSDSKHHEDGQEVIEGVDILLQESVVIKICVLRETMRLPILEVSKRLKHLFNSL